MKFNGLIHVVFELLFGSIFVCGNQMFLRFNLITAMAKEYPGGHPIRPATI
jgi:hypothetical protein